uniref:Uncharacterized protein n=1 Tax=Sphaerodactylus townsendi TaxID=933632 RepID=A0ACB8FR29_9SAUR
MACEDPGGGSSGTALGQGAMEWSLAGLQEPGVWKRAATPGWALPVLGPPLPRQLQAGRATPEEAAGPGQPAEAAPGIPCGRVPPPSLLKASGVDLALCDLMELPPASQESEEGGGGERQEPGRRSGGPPSEGSGSSAQHLSSYSAISRDLAAVAYTLARFRLTTVMPFVVLPAKEVQKLQLIHTAQTLVLFENMSVDL